MRSFGQAWDEFNQMVIVGTDVPPTTARLLKGTFHAGALVAVQMIMEKPEIINELHAELTKYGIEFIMS